MFSILSYFRSADGLQRTCSAGKREKGKEEKAVKERQEEKADAKKKLQEKEAKEEKDAGKVRKARAAAPTLSSFVRVAARGLSRSTADNYRTAVRSFVRFNGGKDLPLSALNADIVHAYERWLRGQGVCPNTSSCYLRSLRAIYN
ncbi:phage integrase SAM-like domain-containing protein, partial [Bacteroides heparinolyticus]|uniref:phage integrase SAM-like domain-containing protein n=1 Tax=Prevotella heparinolytica TaxID=28113 RepID=UPI0028E82426